MFHHYKNFGFIFTLETTGLEQGGLSTSEDNSNPKKLPFKESSIRVVCC